MKLYYGNRSAWTGDLVWAILEMCSSDYWTGKDEDYGRRQAINNFKSSLVMVAQAIITKNAQRNYRYTVETYFHLLCRKHPKSDERFWDWGQFVLKGRIPFGKSGFFAVHLQAEDGYLALEVRCYGQQPKMWRQNVLVAWLHKWGAEILQLPLSVESRTMCVGEYLATELFANCGDEAGRNATLDEIEDRGQKWLLS